MRETVQLKWNEVTRAMSTVEHRTGAEWQSLRERRGIEPRRPGPELARIGTHLRALYQAVEEEPVPDRLRQLLGRMDERRG